MKQFFIVINFGQCGKLHHTSFKKIDMSVTVRPYSITLIHFKHCGYFFNSNKIKLALVQYCTHRITLQLSSKLVILFSIENLE